MKKKKEIILKTGNLTFTLTRDDINDFVLSNKIIVDSSKKIYHQLQYLETKRLIFQIRLLIYC